MKKLILLAAILIGAHTANAQINEGNIMVGGTLAGFNADFDHSTSLTLSPKAAWFVQDGLAIGGYVNLGFTHLNGANTTYNYGLGPLARYYFQAEKVGNLSKAKFFWEGNVGFEGTSSTKKNGVGGGSTNGLGFGVGPGLAYFITPNIGLEALVKYNGIVGFGSNAYTNNLSIGLGFQVYLPSSKAKSEIKRF